MVALDAYAEGRACKSKDGARHSKKSDGVLCAGISVKYAWIERHKSCWPVTRQCEVLNVSASGYFEHQRRRIADNLVISGKRLSDAALLAHIKAVHAASKGEYGMHSSISRKANCWDNAPIESLWGR